MCVHTRCLKFLPDSFHFNELIVWRMTHNSRIIPSDDKCRILCYAQWAQRKNTSDRGIMLLIENTVYAQRLQPTRYHSAPIRNTRPWQHSARGILKARYRNVLKYLILNLSGWQRLFSVWANHGTARQLHSQNFTSAEKERTNLELSRYAACKFLTT